MPPHLNKPPDVSAAPQSDGEPALGTSPTGLSVGVRDGQSPAVQTCARPCRPCPWRRDNAGRYRYANLSEYAEGTVPREPGFGQPDDADPLAALGTLFACHAAAGGQHLCAGHLAVVGAAHPLVRLGVVWGLIDPALLEPGADWPPLWDSYAEMLDAVGPDSPVPAGAILVDVRDEL